MMKTLMINCRWRNALFILCIVILLTGYLRDFSRNVSLQSETGDHVNRHHLQKRALKPLQRDNKKQIECHLPDRLKETTTQTLGPNDKWPYAVWNAFGTSSIAVGTSYTDDPEVDLWVGLEGCTVLVILNGQGAWIAHLWEYPGFGTRRVAIDTIEGAANRPKFEWIAARTQKEVYDFITNGKASKTNVEEPADDSAKLRDLSGQLRDAQAWIIGPSATASRKESARYKNQYAEIRRLVEQHIGPVKWHETLYYTEEGSDEDLVQVLFEYDADDRKARLVISNQVVFEGDPDNELI